jgi:cellulose synthase/poly-beta-1,6-N-acetylglucosamine synthase-like glycosyltransferase
LPSRQSKPAAVNIGLALCSGEIVLIIDADTVLAPGAVAVVLGYFSDPKVGGVNFHLQVRNERATLTTWFQAIEYSIAVSAGKRMADALGILPNVSGAAGAFRRTALEQVGGQDIEVAEDAALSMKLRDAGWQLRFAPDAIARTTVPETPVSLLLQRLRWDSSIITIYWRKHARNLNPFGRHFSLANMLTNLDVVWFSAILPLVLPVYLVWLYNSVGEVSITFLVTVFLGLCALDVILCVVTCVPLRFWPYVPYYVIVQNLDFEANYWNGLFLPKGTPEPVVQKLHDAVVATIDNPSVQARLKEVGVTVVAQQRRSREYLQKFVASEIEKWAGPIKISGVRLD